MEKILSFNTQSLQEFFCCCHSCYQSPKTSKILILVNPYLDLQLTAAPLDSALPLQNRSTTKPRSVERITLLSFQYPKPEILLSL